MSTVPAAETLPGTQHYSHVSEGGAVQAVAATTDPCMWHTSSYVWVHRGGKDGLNRHSKPMTLQFLRLGRNTEKSGNVFL